MKVTPVLRHKAFIVICLILLMIPVYGILANPRQFELRDELLFIGVLVLAIFVSLRKLKSITDRKRDKTDQAE